MLIGIGVDVVEIDRFRETMERTPSIIGRVFSETERTDMGERRDPAPGYAARFAAKEAVLKAMSSGLGAADLAEISITKAESGAPSLELTGRAAALAASLGVQRWHVSLSHSRNVAQAYVVAEGGLTGAELDGAGGNDVPGDAT